MKKSSILDKIKKKKGLSANASKVVAKVKEAKNQCPYPEFSLPITSGESRTGSRTGDLFTYLESMGIYMYDSHSDSRLSPAQAEKLLSSAFNYPDQLHNVLWSFRTDSQVSQSFFNSKCVTKSFNTDKKGVKKTTGEAKEEVGATSKKLAAKVALKKKLAARKKQ